MSEFDVGALASSPSVKFENIGDRVKGVIATMPEMVQQTDIETREPLFWSDGRPREQLLIRLDCDGESRMLYVRGGNFEVAQGEGTSLGTALLDALAAAGVGSKIAVGGTLEVVHTGLGKRTNNAFSPPKLYRMRYTPPEKAVEVGGLFSDDGS